MWIFLFAFWLTVINAATFDEREWRKLENTAAESFCDITIWLKWSNEQPFFDYLNAVSHPLSPSYGQYKSLKELFAWIAPSVATQATIQSWLNVSQIAASQVRPLASRRDVLVVRRVSNVQFAALFNGAQLSHFEHRSSGLRLHRTLDAWSLPQDVRQHVRVIGGVQGFPNMKYAAVTNGVGAIPRKPEIGPNDINRVYSVGPSPPQPKGNYSQAVVSFLGQYWSSSDLSAFQQANNLPQHPIDHLYGPNRVTSPGVEASLDVQYLLGLSPNFDTWVISTSGHVGQNEPWLDFMMELSQLSQTTTLPKVFSMSYQDIEATQRATYAIAVSSEFALFSGAGHTFVTGSGDWGVGCQTDSTFAADFPSTSPYVVSSGATQFISPTKTPQLDEQKAVTFSSGGFSNIFQMPAYQKKAVQSFLKQTNVPSSLFNPAGRAFPDISVIGVGFKVFYKGSVIPVDGTSAATPTIAAFLSMINAKRINAGKSSLGWVQPALYHFYDQFPNVAFYDIQLGSNPYTNKTTGTFCQGFNATKGWDPITGVGTPIYSKLETLFMTI